MVIQGGEAMLGRDRPVILIELLRKWARKFDYHPTRWWSGLVVLAIRPIP